MSLNIFVNKKVLKKFVQLNKKESKRMAGEDRPIFSVARVDNLDNGCYLMYTNTHYIMGFKIAELSDNIEPALLDLRKIEALILTIDGNVLDLSRVLECTSDVDGSYPSSQSILRHVNTQASTSEQSHAYNPTYIRTAVEFVGVYAAEYVSKNNPVYEVTSECGVRKYFDKNKHSFAVVCPVRQPKGAQYGNHHSNASVLHYYTKVITKGLYKMKVVKTEVNAYEFHELTKEVQQRVCEGILEDLKKTVVL